MAARLSSHRWPWMQSARQRWKGTSGRSRARSLLLGAPPPRSTMRLPLQQVGMQQRLLAQCGSPPRWLPRPAPVAIRCMAGAPIALVDSLIRAVHCTPESCRRTSRRVASPAGISGWMAGAAAAAPPAHRRPQHRGDPLPPPALYFRAPAASELLQSRRCCTCSGGAW